MFVYPEVEVINDRGTRKKVPADTPVKIFVTTAVGQSQTADVTGQISMNIIRCLTRSAPVGPWSRVVLDGLEYDIDAPPRFTPGASKASSHVEFTIRSRSQLNVPKP